MCPDPEQLPLTSLKVNVLPPLNVAAEGSDAVIAEPVVIIPINSFSAITLKSAVEKL